MGERRTSIQPFDPTLYFQTYRNKSADLPIGQSMHQGVVRDMEQQRVKKERQLDFDLQRQLEAEYKKEQSVRNTLAEMDEKGAGAGRGR